MSSVWTIAALEFRDRLRSGWVVACLVVWLAVISLTSVFGLIQIGHIGVQGYQRTTMSLLNLVQYLVPLLGLLVGHDLIVREREDRTLNLLLASGVTRFRIALGKFGGAALAISTPLALGFAISGTLIRIAAHDVSFAPFLKLAFSGLVLGIAFSGIGLVVSTFARTRVQALVCALLTWGVAVFAFDLAALGIIVSTRSAPAAQEIDLVCDATHVNNQADIHAAFDAPATPTKHSQAVTSKFTWLWINPVDVFRVVNFPAGIMTPMPVTGMLASGAVWLLLSLGAASCKLQRVDL